MKTKTKKIVIKGKKGSREKDTLRRLDRIISILCMLKEGQVNVRELETYFDIDKRNIQKDIKLIGKKFQLERLGNTCNYAFAAGESLGSKSFLLDDKVFNTFASVVDLALASGIPPEAINRMLQRTGINSAPGSDIVHIMPRVIAPKIPHYEQIQEAIDNRHELALEYQPAPDREVKTHTLCPIKLLASDGFYYVYGFYSRDPENKRRYPKYRLDRVKAIKVLDQTFMAPYDAEDELKGARNIWSIHKEQERNIQIKLRITGYARDYFRTHDIIEGQKITEKTDESLIYEARIGMLEEITPQILRWMPCVTVLAPKLLKEEITSHIKDFNKLQK